MNSALCFLKVEIVIKIETMKVKCISNKVGISEDEAGVFSYSNLVEDSISLIEGKEYEVLAENDGFYQVVDESGESYWHPMQAFIKL